MKDFGKNHKLTAMLASNYNDEEQEYYTLSMTDFPDDYVQNAI